MEVNQLPKRRVYQI